MNDAYPPRHTTLLREVVVIVMLSVVFIGGVVLGKWSEQAKCVEACHFGDADCVKRCVARGECPQK